MLKKFLEKILWEITYRNMEMLTMHMNSDCLRACVSSPRFRKIRHRETNRAGFLLKHQAPYRHKVLGLKANIWGGLRNVKSVKIDCFSWAGESDWITWVGVWGVEVYENTVLSFWNVITYKASWKKKSNDPGERASSIFSIVFIVFFQNSIQCVLIAFSPHPANSFLIHSPTSYLLNYLSS